MRSRRAPGTYRSALVRLGWPRLLAIAALGVGVAVLLLALTASAIVRRGNPALALRFMPTDGLALAYRAEQLSLRDPDHPSANVRELARAALRAQAINPTALRILSYVASGQADTRRARTLMLQAQGQSRRDASTQLWLIEDAVQHGDIRQALFHYDIVLRNKPGTYTLLFPILLQTLGDPAIRTELARYIRTDEIWAPQFFAYALANSKDLPALVALDLASGGLKNRQIAQEEDVGLIARLIAENRFGEVRRVYLHMAGATPGRLVDPAFDRADSVGRFGAVGWQTRVESQASSSFDGDVARPSLTISANALTTSNVATRLLFLGPGRYRVAVELAKRDGGGGKGASLAAQIRCPTLAGDQPVWSQSSEGLKIIGTISLPTGCNVQYMDLVATGGTGAGGMEAVIRSVAIRSD